MKALQAVDPALTATKYVRSFLLKSFGGKRFSAGSSGFPHCLCGKALSDCREGRILADAQERFGLDFCICGMLTAATYPEDTVLSRAVSRKSYQEEN